MEDLGVGFGVPLFQESSLNVVEVSTKGFERQHQAGDLQKAIFSSDQIGGLGLSRAYGFV